MKRSLVLFLCILVLRTVVSGQVENDVISTSDGDLRMYFIGHSTLMFTLNDKVIHIDPTTMYGNYDNAPKADLILITHEHGDHFDIRAIRKIIKEDTRIVATGKCLGPLAGMDPLIMKNGEDTTIHGIGIKAMPAYNIRHKQFNWKPYHEEGDGNSYVLTFGDTRVLIGGDTENIPELKALEDIDIAFLPMDLPFTMTPEMVADLARSMRPDILYPYHYSRSNPQRLVDLLSEEEDIDVRIRKLR